MAFTPEKKEKGRKIALEEKNRTCFFRAPLFFDIFL
jgi:hypothetical protein